MEQADPGIFAVAGKCDETRRRLFDSGRERLRPMNLGRPRSFPGHRADDEIELAFFKLGQEMLGRAGRVSDFLP